MAKRSAYAPAKKHIKLTIGDSVRIARELQGMTQLELAKASGIPQGTISAIEKNKVNLGAERARLLARALKTHPAVLLFPDWENEELAETA